MKKFNKEIKMLRNLGGQNDSSLHPLRKEQIKRAVLAVAANEPRTADAGLILIQKKNDIIKYIVSTLIGISLVGGTAFAANDPGVRVGSPLFPIKKLTENIQVALTADVQAKARLREKIAEERLEDLLEIKAKLKNQEQQTQPAIQQQPEQTVTQSRDAQPQQPKQRQQNEKKDKSKTDISKTNLEAQANDEFSQAVNNLKDVKSNLEAKGDVKAAEELDKNILRLQTRSGFKTDDRQNDNQQNGRNTEQQNGKDGGNGQDSHNQSEQDNQSNQQSGSGDSGD